MSTYTTAQIIIKSLIANGVDTIFGIPGVQNDWLYNALFDYRDQIKIIHTRHEQGAAYMALGYYLASGKPGVYNVVPGPGFLNSTAALATAYALNTKVLCLTGQIPTKVQGKKWGTLHEINNQMDIMDSLTKWSDKIVGPEDAAQKVNQAFYEMNSTRPRPFGLEVAMDVLAQKMEFNEQSIALAIETPDQLPADAAIADAARILSEAKQPLIFIGGGASDASIQIQQLAEFLDAPVFSYRTGKGILSANHPLSFPLPAAHSLWKECDVAIAIGTQMRMPLLKWGVDDRLKLISINIDPDEHNRIVQADISISAAADVSIDRILKSLSGMSTSKLPDKNKWISFRENWNNQTAYLEPQLSYLKIIRDCLPADGIFVDELTQIGFASRMLWASYKPRTYLSTGYMGTLGWGFPTSLGAKIAKPDTHVISVCGDGGFMYNVQELATAVQFKIPIVVLLFNNGLFGNVRRMQEELYDNRIIATDLQNPDFIQLVKSFGANAIRIEKIDELKSALEEAMKSDLPTVIEIPVSNNWPSTDRLKQLPKIRGTK